MKDNTKSARMPELLVELSLLLEAHRPAYRQGRPYLRAVGLVLGEVLAFGRHTVTQSLLALGLTEGDWSGWYRLFSRKRYEEEANSRILLGETVGHVAGEEPYVMGVDGVQVPRSSQKMPGTSWLKAPRTAVFRPGIHRAQRFVHVAWLTPIVAGYSRALPLRWLAAFPAKAIGAAVAGLQGIGWVREQLDQRGRAGQTVLVLADGSYDTAEFWRGLPSRTVAAVRTKKNRHLRTFPEPRSGKGRRRLYGEQAASPSSWLHAEQGWQDTQVEVRGRQQALTYQVAGPFLLQRAATHPVFLLVVRGQAWTAGQQTPKRRRRDAAFYLISAVQQDAAWELPYAAPLLLAWLWQRWELEVTHRELKSGLGLGEKQCWGQRSAVTAVQWSAWVYAVLVLAGYRTWGLLGGPARPERWWSGARRWSLTTLWRSYRAALWGTSQFRALWSPTSNIWLENDGWVAGLFNAALAAARS